MQKTVKLSKVLFLLFVITQTYAQEDSIFWFAAPDISQTHGDLPSGSGTGDGSPLYLHISAVQNTNVVISRPADPAFVPLTFALNQGQSQTLDLLSILPIEQLECHADTTENHGFLIQASPGEIIAYYEMDNRFNRDIYTLKGSNALGTEFTVTTQNIFPNASIFPDAKSGFVVVATEDNTTITVNSDQDFEGVASGVHTKTLNRGQTYNFQALSQDASMHPQGVKVTSDHPIAITIYDDSMDRNPIYSNGGCRDAFCDQYIPECHTGREYVIMNGQLGDEGIDAIWRHEVIIVTAVSDSTIIYIDGLEVDTLDSREVTSFIITNPFTTVFLSNPGYVNYITGTGFGCEQGGAVLPTIDNCTGSNNVTFARSGPSNDMFSLNIMVRNDTLTGSPGRNQATSNFTLTVEGNTYAIPASFFTYTANDSSKAVLIDDSRINGPIYNFFDTIIPTGNPPTVAQMSNPIAKFHLGVLNGGVANGGKYGYFSDYSAIPSAGINGSINTKDVYCGFDPIPLQANGGVNYAWKCISHPELNSNFDRTDTSNVFFTPLSTHDVTYSFEVDIWNECNEIITISIEVTIILSADPSFELSLQEGCSPLEVTITNTSDSDYTEELVWTFENPYVEVNQDTMSNSFNWILPKNLTDVPQNYYITLNGTGKYNSCPASYKDTVVIYPEISAGFDMASTVYCDSVVCTMENTSSGDSLNTYSWDFGDQTVDTAENVNKVYLLKDYYDTTLQINLISTSQWNCKDTATNEVVLPLSVHAKFETSGAENCPPLKLILDASASEMVDTMGWTIQSILKDTLIDAEVDQLINFDYPDLGPDTIYIQLFAEDTNGCSDYARDTVIVFTMPTANFKATPDSGSSPLDVEFSNLSVNADTYNWDFDNGNTSSVFEPLETFETEIDKTFRVQLIAENGFCYDTTYQELKVTKIEHVPFVEEVAPESDYKVYVNKDNHLILEYTILNSIQPFGYVVYDITGKVITTSDRKQIATGTYSESISLDGIAPGVFIVKTQLNGKQRVQKLSFY